MMSNLPELHKANEPIIPLAIADGTKAMEYVRSMRMNIISIRKRLASWDFQLAVQSPWVSVAIILRNPGPIFLHRSIYIVIPKEISGSLEILHQYSFAPHQMIS